MNLPPEAVGILCLAAFMFWFIVYVPLFAYDDLRAIYRWIKRRVR